MTDRVAGRSRGTALRFALFVVLAISCAANAATPTASTTSTGAATTPTEAAATTPAVVALQGVASAAPTAPAPPSAAASATATTAPPSSATGPASTATPVATPVQTTAPTPTPAPPSTPPPPPATGTTVVVMLSDTAITFSPSSVPAGVVTFSVMNHGTTIHELVVLQTSLPHGQIPTDPAHPAQVQQPGFLGAVPNLAPRATGTLTLTLAAGPYVLICNQPAHYLIGMHTAFTVR